MTKLRKALDWLLLKPMAHLCSPVALAINRAGRRNGRAFRFTDIVSAFDNDIQPLPVGNGERSHQRTRISDMWAIGKIPDALAVWYIRRRVRGEPLQRSTAPRLGDRIIAVLQGELNSRAGELARLDADLAAKEAAAADRTRRELAMEQFQSFESENRAQLLQ